MLYATVLQLEHGHYATHTDVAAAVRLAFTTAIKSCARWSPVYKAANAVSNTVNAHSNAAHSQWHTAMHNVLHY
jgi:hypothetical protein